MRYLGHLFGLTIVFPLAACGPGGNSEEPVALSAGASGSIAVVREMCDGRDGLALEDPNRWVSIPRARAAAAIQCDAHEITKRIDDSHLPSSETARLRDHVRELALAALDRIDANSIDSSRLPLSQPHQQMFETAAEAERSSGYGEVAAWVVSPWKPFSPLERSIDAPTESLSVALMRGERRAVAVNVRNTTPATGNVRITVELAGIPGEYMQIYRVNWTGTDLSSWAAAELELLGDATAVREMHVAPGITQQVWIELHPARSSQPGHFVGAVRLSWEPDQQLAIPFVAEVFESVFPARPTLHLSGWDFADGGDSVRYAVTAQNRAAYIAYLESRHVDMPWAHRVVMMFSGGAYTDGSLKGPIKPKQMRNWIAQWRSARRYRVFLHTKQGFGDLYPTDPPFSGAVQAWIQAWGEEIRKNNRSPDQFDLLLLDEPHTPERTVTTLLWAKAIRESGAGIKIWTNPIWPKPEEIPSTLVDAADTIAINLDIAESSGEAYWEWAKQVAARGKNVEIYACQGPARRLDPYAYYRLISWRAFAVGATAVSFWSFAYTANSRSDNEFASGVDARHPFAYSPLFINGDEVRPGKHMEAAAQGIQDAEYLYRLQRIARDHRRVAVREQARALLAQAQDLVAETTPLARSYWRSQRENLRADQLRTSIGRFLDLAGAM